MALPLPSHPSLFFFLLLLLTSTRTLAATWCVARSDASSEVLQAALDYSCSAGADCAPIQSNGLCYLPNTIQAHASYAFNSFYHRKSMAPGSCQFSGAATIATTDPSYGSCVYPNSLRTAGGTPTTATTPGGTSSNSPTSTMPTTTTPLYSNGGNGLTPGTTSPLTPTTTADASQASPNILINMSLRLVLLCVSSIFYVPLDRF